MLRKAFTYLVLYCFAYSHVYAGKIELIFQDLGQDSEKRIYQLKIKPKGRIYNVSTVSLRKAGFENHLKAEMNRAGKKTFSLKFTGKSNDVFKVLNTELHHLQVTGGKLKLFKNVNIKYLQLKNVGVSNTKRATLTSSKVMAEGGSWSNLGKVNVKEIFQGSFDDYRDAGVTRATVAFLKMTTGQITGDFMAKIAAVQTASDFILPKTAKLTVSKNLSLATKSDLYLDGGEVELASSALGKVENTASIVSILSDTGAGITMSAAGDIHKNSRVSSENTSIVYQAKNIFQAKKSQAGFFEGNDVVFQAANKFIAKDGKSESAGGNTVLIAKNATVERDAEIKAKDAVVLHIAGTLVRRGVISADKMQGNVFFYVGDGGGTNVKQLQLETLLAFDLFNNGVRPETSNITSIIEIDPLGKMAGTKSYESFNLVRFGSWLWSDNVTINSGLMNVNVGATFSNNYNSNAAYSFSRGLRVAIPTSRESLTSMFTNFQIYDPEQAWYDQKLFRYGISLGCYIPKVGMVFKVADVGLKTYDFSRQIYQMHQAGFFKLEPDFWKNPGMIAKKTAGFITLGISACSLGSSILGMRGPLPKFDAKKLLWSAATSVGPSSFTDNNIWNNNRGVDFALGSMTKRSVFFDGQTYDWALDRTVMAVTGRDECGLYFGGNSSSSALLDFEINQKALLFGDYTASAGSNMKVGENNHVAVLGDATVSAGKNLETHKKSFVGGVKSTTLMAGVDLTHNGVARSGIEGREGSVTLIAGNGLRLGKNSVSKADNVTMKYGKAFAKEDGAIANGKNFSIDGDDLPHLTDLLKQNGKWQGFSFTDGMWIKTNGSHHISQSVAAPVKNLYLVTDDLVIGNMVQITAGEILSLKAAKGNVKVGYGSIVNGSVFTQVHAAGDILGDSYLHTTNWDTKHTKQYTKDIDHREAHFRGGSGIAYLYTDPETGEEQVRLMGLDIKAGGDIKGKGMQFSAGGDVLIKATNFENKGEAINYLKTYTRKKRKKNTKREYGFDTLFIEGKIESRNGKVIVNIDGDFEMDAGSIISAAGCDLYVKRDIRTPALHGMTGRKTTREFNKIQKAWRVFCPKDSEHEDETVAAVKEFHASGDVRHVSKEGDIVMPGLEMYAPNSHVLLEGNKITLEKIILTNIHTLKGFEAKFSLNPFAQGVGGSIDYVHRKRTHNVLGPGGMVVEGMTVRGREEFNQKSGFGAKVSGDMTVETKAWNQTAAKLNDKTTEKRVGVHGSVSKDTKGVGVHGKYSSQQSKVHANSNNEVGGNLGGKVGELNQDGGFTKAATADIDIDNINSRQKQNTSRSKSAGASVSYNGAVSGSVDLSYRETRKNAGKSGLEVGQAKKGMRVGGGSVQGSKVKIKSGRENAEIGDIKKRSMPKEKGRGFSFGIGGSSDAGGGKPGLTSITGGVTIGGKTVGGSVNLGRNAAGKALLTGMSVNARKGDKSLGLGVNLGKTQAGNTSLTGVSANAKKGDKSIGLGVNFRKNNAGKKALTGASAQVGKNGKTIGAAFNLGDKKEVIYGSKKFSATMSVDPQGWKKAGQKVKELADKAFGGDKTPDDQPKPIAPTDLSAADEVIDGAKSSLAKVKELNRELDAAKAAAAEKSVSGEMLRDEKETDFDNEIDEEVQSAEETGTSQYHPVKEDIGNAELVKLLEKAERKDASGSDLEADDSVAETPVEDIAVVNGPKTDEDSDTPNFADTAKSVSNLAKDQAEENKSKDGSKCGPNKPVADAVAPDHAEALKDSANILKDKVGENMNTADSKKQHKPKPPRDATKLLKRLIKVFTARVQEQKFSSSSTKGAGGSSGKKTETSETKFCERNQPLEKISDNKPVLAGDEPVVKGKTSIYSHHTETEVTIDNTIKLGPDSELGKDTLGQKPNEPKKMVTVIETQNPQKIYKEKGGFVIGETNLGEGNLHIVPEVNKVSPANSNVPATRDRSVGGQATGSKQLPKGVTKDKAVVGLLNQASKKPIYFLDGTKIGFDDLRAYSQVEGVYKFATDKSGTIYGIETMKNNNVAFLRGSKEFPYAGAFARSNSGSLIVVNTNVPAVNLPASGVTEFELVQHGYRSDGKTGMGLAASAKPNATTNIMKPEAIWSEEAFHMAWSKYGKNLTHDQYTEIFNAIIEDFRDFRLDALQKLDQQMTSFNDTLGFKYRSGDFLHGNACNYLNLGELEEVFALEGYYYNTFDSGLKKALGNNYQAYEKIADHARSLPYYGEVPQGGRIYMMPEQMSGIVEEQLAKIAQLKESGIDTRPMAKRMTKIYEHHLGKMNEQNLANQKFGGGDHFATCRKPGTTTTTTSTVGKASPKWVGPIKDWGNKVTALSNESGVTGMLKVGGKALPLLDIVFKTKDELEKGNNIPNAVGVGTVKMGSDVAVYGAGMLGAGAVGGPVTALCSAVASIVAPYLPEYSDEQIQAVISEMKLESRLDENTTPSQYISALLDDTEYLHTNVDQATYMRLMAEQRNMQGWNAFKDTLGAVNTVADAVKEHIIDPSVEAIERKFPKVVVFEEKADKVLRDTVVHPAQNIGRFEQGREYRNGMQEIERGNKIAKFFGIKPIDTSDMPKPLNNQEIMEEVNAQAQATIVEEKRLKEAREARRKAAG